ncbi:MAG: MvaI/BcnI restriction endonuclease family protein [Treponema sp.]|nr:MvaI/BcnI restriction endonuclease family protein [Treponema sp.]
MRFSSIRSISSWYESKCITRVYFKLLAENDNSKQQLYLGGGDLSTLQQIPLAGEVTAEPGPEHITYKAPVSWYWIAEDGSTQKAPGAQLIEYSKYPEFRLSGFLKGCSAAPSQYMQPVPKEKRCSNNGKDGRVLVMGIKGVDIFAYLAPKGSALAGELINSSIRFLPEFRQRKTVAAFDVQPTENISINDLPDGRMPVFELNLTTREKLYEKLRPIVNQGYISPEVIGKNGVHKTDTAPNAGGCTLETAFGIQANAAAEPDYKGWELKAYSGTVLTLFTPEPDAGFYHEHKTEFVRKYGHNTDKDPDVRYFSGPFSTKNYKFGLKLVLRGFDEENGKVTDLNGAVELIDEDGKMQAAWTFPKLLHHWQEKHAHVCYVKFSKNRENHRIKYSPVVHIGEGTDFEKFLQAVANGTVYYDPGTKVARSDDIKVKVKTRSQFRVKDTGLKYLYNSFTEEDLTDNGHN